jgi:hypothetical protein
MECKELETHLADHLAGTLPPEIAEQVAAHLRTCAACAVEADGLQDTWQTLGTLRAERPDSAVMRARFEAALAGYQSAITPGQTSPPLMRLWPARYAAWASAAAAILVVGIAVGRQTVAEPPAADPQIVELREEVRVMREMVTLSLMQQQSASERLKGVSFTRMIDQPGGEITDALLDALMHDPSDSVRLRTVDALKRFADQEGVRRATADALTRQSSPLVQAALIDFVVEINNRQAADALRQLSADPMVNQAVRARAERGLARMGV